MTGPKSLGIGGKFPETQGWEPTLITILITMFHSPDQGWLPSLKSNVGKLCRVPEGETDGIRNPNFWGFKGKKNYNERIFSNI